jgi:hypothetical protein
MIMKTGIFIALAALALAVVAVPDAHGWWHRGPELNLRVAGSSFITSSQDDGTPSPLGGVFTSMQSGKAKGAGGGIFTSQAVVGAAGLEPRCEPPFPLGGNITFFQVVLTDSDGSILTLQASEDSFYCTDGSTFVANAGGSVLGGEGRYEGATGTWDVSAQIFQSRVTGTLTADLE